MVFGLFSRKAEPKPTAETPTTTTGLRTPSPSVLSGSIGDERIPPITPSPPPAINDAATLRALIQSIPPKTLQSYTLSHLATASPQLVENVVQFFSALQAPPKLHCVRCHAGYFDADNNNHSCCVAHDDESAEVDRRETLWNCCGKTVEGDGSEGPPEGWCFEGAHTTDLKRARFRADSTIHDDKLVSCARKHCHDPPGSRKRPRRVADNSDTESESDDDGASHSSIRTRSKRARTVRESDTEEDVDMSPAHSLQASPKSSASRRKPRAKSIMSNASARSLAPKSKSSKSRSTVLSLPDPPSSPSRGKKPPSTRFAPVVEVSASFTSTTSSAVSVDGSQQTQSQSQTQTIQAVVASSSKVAKAPAKRTMKPKQPKQPKRLNDVVEGSIDGEI